MKRWIALCLVLLTVGVWAADELQLTTGWQYNKNDRKRILAPTATKYDVTGDGVIENVQLIPTNVAGSATALELGGVTTPGFGWFHNTDPTNHVKVGTYATPTNFVALVELKPDEKAALFLATTNVAAVALTNSVKLDYMIVDR